MDQKIEMSPLAAMIQGLHGPSPLQHTSAASVVPCSCSAGPTDPAAVRHAEQTAAAAAAAAVYEAYNAKIEGKSKRPQDAHVLFSEPNTAGRGGGGEAGAGEGGGEGADGGSDAEEGEGAATGATAGEAKGAGAKAAGVAGGEEEVCAELLMPEMVYRVEPGLIGKAETGPEVRLQYLPTGHVLSTGPTLAPLTISKGPDTLVFTTSDHKGVGRQPEQLARARAAEVASGTRARTRVCVCVCACKPAIAVSKEACGRQPEQHMHACERGITCLRRYW
eukprot:1161263-Pelagomonas_calceolata.AAC.17